MTSTDHLDELEARVRAQRAALAETTDALSHKLDVKSQAAAHRNQIGAYAVAAAGLVAAALWWRSH